MEYLEIKNTRIPAIGLGTWNITGKACIEAVVNALKLGYRHIDTARNYNNEKEVGEGIRQSGIRREDVFLTTKIPPVKLEPDLIEQTALESLEKLKTGYIDLLLIHWPTPRMDLRGCLDEMVRLRNDGIVKNIGVSNFTPRLFKEALSMAPVICNQIEFTPYHADFENLRFSHDKGLMITAYSPLAKGYIKNDSHLQEIGRKYNKTSGQVALRWLLQLGNMSVIPKAANPNHQKENLQLFDFKLEKSDMEKITSLSKVKEY